MDKITTKEFNTVIEILDKAIEGKRVSLDAKLVRDIVPIEVWLDSQYYLGPDADRIYPFWKREIADVFNDPNGISEVIITGSIGCGKSTAALVIFIRKLYELSCYENIRALFKLMSSSSIAFIYFSLSKMQAQLTGFGQIRDFIDSIPYFHEYFCRDEKISSILLWPQEKLLLTHGSEAIHGLGMNLIGAIMDEANFHKGESSESNQASVVTAVSKIARLYTSIVNRSKSRFTTDGKDNSISILISSPTHSSSFTEERISKGMDDPHTKIIDAKLWDVKPVGTYSATKFYVFRGNDKLDPYIVDTIADFKGFTESAGIGLEILKEWSVEDAIKHLSDAHQQLFVGVPLDFKRSFESSLIQSMQDIAGVSVAPIGRLFSSRISYNKCVRAELEHPFTKQEFVISTGDTVAVSDYLRPGHVWRHPKAKRYLHIDQSLANDSTGISCFHIASFTEISGVMYPIIETDFMLRINPPKRPYQIDIGKVRDFVFYLVRTANLQIGNVTYDCFASDESRQVMTTAGLNAGYLSVDRDDKAYMTMVNLIMEARLILYKYIPFEEELFNLIHNRARRKVDHPINGSKDVTDSVAGAIYNAILSLQKGDEQDNTFNLDEFMGINSESVENDKQDLMKGVLGLPEGYSQMDLEFNDPDDDIFL